MDASLTVHAMMMMMAVVIMASDDADEAGEEFVEWQGGKTL